MDRASVLRSSTRQQLQHRRELLRLERFPDSYTCTREMHFETPRLGYTRVETHVIHERICSPVLIIETPRFIILAAYL